MKPRGFTLLEMMVATLIMGIAVIGLMGEITASMRNASRVTERDRAALLARSKMDELLLDPQFPLETPVAGAFDPVMTGGVEGGLERASVPVRDAARSRALPTVARPHVAGDLVDGRQRAPHFCAVCLSRACAAQGGSPAMMPRRFWRAGFSRRGASAPLRGRQSGLTLMEVIIAVALLSMLSRRHAGDHPYGLRRAAQNQRPPDGKPPRGRSAARARARARRLHARTRRCVPWPRKAPGAVCFFQGQPQSMRLVSTYSLQEAWRGQPRILELQVILRRRKAAACG